MFDATQKKQLKRQSKPFPLMGLIRGNNSSTCCSNSDSNNIRKELGSGVTSPVILNSISKNNDPYMPHIHHEHNLRSHSSTSLPSTKHKKHPARRSTNSSTPHLVTHPHRQPVSPSSPTLLESPQHHYYFNPPTSPNLDRYDTTAIYPSVNQQKFYNLYHQNTSTSSNQLVPPLSPPPLSPTNMSFAATSPTRPSWRDMRRSPTWQPASSISSSDEEEDDNEPIGLLLLSKPFSLLSDTSEDGDDELIPIAQLSISSHRLSAAEKYKAKVRARLQMTDNNNSNEVLF